MVPARRSLSALLAALIVACVAGTGIGALWQPRPAAAETIRDLSWYLDEMHVDEAQSITEGDGVTIAVVDTGVDSHHPDLQGRVLDGMEIGTGESAAPTGNGKDDTDGHGTGMASLIAGAGDGPNSVLGVAPASRILPVRIAQNAEGAFRPEDVYEGVRWAIDHGAKVVNISLGGERTTDAPWKKRLIDYAVSKDVVLIAAAGNTGEGDKKVAEPAAIPGVVAVSGVRRDGTFWEGSARGPEVVVSAPAEALPHAVPRSVSSSGYALADGTSGATALVSGVAALIRSAFPDASANDVVNRLIHTVEDRGSPGRDDEYGYGAVDARTALEGDVPGARHHPLVSPKAERSASAAGAGEGGTDGALIVLGMLGGSVLLLLVVVYLVVLARRSRQVVVAGVTPPMASPQVPGGGFEGPGGSGHVYWPGSGSVHQGVQVGSVPGAPAVPAGAPGPDVPGPSGMVGVPGRNLTPVYGVSPATGGSAPAGPYPPGPAAGPYPGPAGSNPGPAYQSGQVVPAGVYPAGQNPPVVQRPPGGTAGVVTGVASGTAPPPPQSWLSSAAPSHGPFWPGDLPTSVPTAPGFARPAAPSEAGSETQRMPVVAPADPWPAGTEQRSPSGAQSPPVDPWAPPRGS